MKIAVISLYLPTGLQGGVPIQVHRLCNELVRRGHRVTVFSLYPAPTDAAYAVKQVQLPKILQRLVDRTKGWGMFFFPWYVAKEDFSGFDLIHAHGDSHFIRARVPVIRTYHSAGMLLARYPSSLRQFCGLMAIYPFELLSAWRADRCIFVSRAMKPYFPGIPCEVINTAVDLTAFQPKPASKSAEPTILFVAASLSGRKRGALLVDAFRNFVLPRIPGARLWLVCEERVEGPQIKCWGLLSGPPLIQLYQSSWVFCLPSAVETVGVPYIEALACGTPAVATPNAGASEVLADGTYGVMTSSEHLGETLVNLLSDVRRRYDLAVKGVERAKAFGLDKVVDRYEQLYTDVLKKKSS